MRVGLDYRPALLGKTGIGRYAAGLVKGLVENGRGCNLKLYGAFRGASRLRPGAVPADVRAFLRPIPGRISDGLGRIGLTPDRAMGGCDVWHHTDFVVPRTRCPALMTLHDVLFLRSESYHGSHRTGRLRRVLELARERCAMLVVPSWSAAADAVRLAAMPPDRIRVVPPGVDLDWIAGAAPPPRSRPYLLAVGSLEPRKNLPRLFEAFGRLAADRPDLDLLVAGPSHHRAEDVEAARVRCPAAERIRLLGRVPDDALASLYRGAAALAYVSLVEGFGLPALEGLAAAIPVVTSRGTAMEEVVGDAAILVDPHRVESIEEGLRLAFGAEGRTLAAAGPARARRFTWARTARGMWSAYEEATAR